LHVWVGKASGGGNGEQAVWKRPGKQADGEKAACRRVSQWEGTGGEAGCIHWWAEPVGKWVAGWVRPMGYMLEQTGHMQGWARQGELGDGKWVGGRESRAKWERW